jgi:uncharacterized protein YggE
MKKTFLILFTTLSALTQAQEIKPIPTVNVAGEGKIKIVPDQVSITIGGRKQGNQFGRSQKRKTILKSMRYSSRSKNSA